MNTTKRTSEDKLAIKSAKAHYKQFMNRFPERAREEKLSAQSHVLQRLSNAKSNIKFGILNH